jgi:acyl-CoA reductase-like NAD-dependent aldehyde dehydrogenase
VSTCAIIDPGTGETVKESPPMSDAELDAALNRASEAYRAWGCGSTAAERAALLGRASELYAERRDELAKIISREMGKPVAQALGEVDFSAAIYAYYAENAEKFLADEPVHLAWGEGTAVVRRAPQGIPLGIMPWNYPYYQVARFAAPNLITGNTFLLKLTAALAELQPGDPTSEETIVGPVSSRSAAFPLSLPRDDGPSRRGTARVGTMGSRCSSTAGVPGACAAVGYRAAGPTLGTPRPRSDPARPARRPRVDQR